MLPAPDFLRPRRGVPPLAWLFLAAALAALAVAGADAWSAHDERDTAHAAVQRLRAAPAPRAAAPQRQQAALAPVLQVLGAPWRQRFEALEAAAMPGLAWMSMDLAHDGELHLVGSTSRSATALEAAQKLRASGAWRSVVVTRIEQGSDGAQRVEIRAAAAEGPGR